MVDSQRYCAYLLRGWLEDGGDGMHNSWRFRLQDVQTGEARAFASLEAVTKFLVQEFDQDDEEDASPVRQ